MKSRGSAGCLHFALGPVDFDCGLVFMQSIICSGTILDYDFVRLRFRPEKLTDGRPQGVEQEVVLQCFCESLKSF